MASGLGPSLGWQVGHWIETFLCHGPGDLRGEPWPITDDAEWYAFLAKAYELKPESGRRAVQEAMLSRPKGRAKSELAGGVVCVELIGPARFDHWAVKGETSWWGYEYEKGEPVGRPVRDPFIRCLATEETQAGNTYDNVQVMLEHLDERHGEHFPGLDIGKTRVFVAGGGEVRPSTASSAAKDGGKETFAVADETHLYLLPELHDMFDTVSRNLTKRRLAEPWLLQTSTMYQPGQDSEAERCHKRQGTDRGLLFDHHQAEPPEDWDDDEQLLAALHEAYRDADWIDYEAKLRECRRTTRPRACRYFLNRPEVDEDQAVDPAVWRALTVPGPLPEDGAFVTLGFDGSESRDATALVGTEMVSGRQFLVAVWERPRGQDAPLVWRVPTAEVNRTVTESFKHWRVARMLCDPRGWRSEIAEWQRAFGDEVVLEFPTNQWGRMSKAVDRWLSAVTEKARDDGELAVGLTHNGDPDLARHVGNARLLAVNPRNPDKGVVLGKAEEGRKIDAAVASVLSWEARDALLAAGWKPARKIFIY